MSARVLWLAQLVARNIVPLGGVLLLGWDARNVLVVYCVDTMLGMGVIWAGLAGAFVPAGSAARRREFAHGAGPVIPVTIVLVAATLPFVIGSHYDWRAAFADPALRTGVLWQAIAALWSCRALIRALRETTPEALRLARSFAFVLSRWLTMAFVAIVVPAAWLGAHASVVLVALYIVLTIWAEVAPQHFAADRADDAQAGPARDRAERGGDRASRRRPGRDT